MTHIADLKQGDTLYDSNGVQLEFLMYLDDAYLVRPVYDRDEDEPNYGEPYIIHRAFREPGKEIYAPQIDELLQRKEEVETDIASLRSQAEEARARLNNLRQFAVLTDLENFLAGKITHCAVCRYQTWELAEFGTLLTPRDEPRTLKLVSLFGKSSGDLVWKINTYYDGSGSNITIVPFTSREQAVEFIKAKVAAQFQEHRDQGDKGMNYLLRCGAETSTKLGFELPDDVREYMRKTKLENAESNFAQAKAKYEEAQAAVAALRGEVVKP